MRESLVGRVLYIYNYIKMLALVMAALLIALSAEYLASSAVGTYNLLLVMLLALLCWLPFMKERVKESYNPILLLSVIYFLEYGVSYLYFHYCASLVPLHSRLDLNILNKGLLFVVFCFLALLIGYYLADFNGLAKILLNKGLKKAFRIFNLHQFDFSERRLPTMLALLFLTGWSARLILIKLGGYFHIVVGENALATEYAGLAQFLKFCSLLPFLAVIIFFLKYWQKKANRVYLLMGVIFFLLELAYALPSGSKAAFLSPIFILFVIYSIINTTPVKTLAAVFLIVIFFVFPFTDFYRGVISGNYSSDLRESFDAYQNAFETRAERVTWKGALARVFGGRLNFLSIVSITIAKTPEAWNFQNGWTYFLFIPSLVPRIMWPDKPAITIDTNQFARDYGISHRYDYVTSVGPVWIGEMYLNFGWLGVFVASIYGFLYRFIYLYFFRHGKPNALGTIVYAFTILIVVQGSMFAPAFSGLLKFILFILIISMPFSKKLRAISMP